MRKEESIRTRGNLKRRVIPETTRAMGRVVWNDSFCLELQGSEGWWKGGGSGGKIKTSRRGCQPSATM